MNFYHSKHVLYDERLFLVSSNDMVYMLCQRPTCGPYPMGRAHAMPPRLALHIQIVLYMWTPRILQFPFNLSQARHDTLLIMFEFIV